MMPTIIPPIKCQGIKTKLIKFIKKELPGDFNVWYEPFMGSGVVGFNVQPKQAVFSDTNPHLIQFYNDIKTGIVDYNKIKSFLIFENEKLMMGDDDYYKEVRARFNKSPNSLDFLFLNRSCFNGMMRFNSRGGFKVPFCKKPNRFAQAYITKIVNQVKNIQVIITNNDYKFICCSFEETIKKATENDLIYCDPPYIDRHSDYYNQWKEEDESSLFDSLKKTRAKFILSTWHHNKYRKNTYIDMLWNEFNISTTSHFYHIGGKEDNRNEMIETLVKNF